MFNAHYLTWADEASNHWWAAHGLPWDVVAARVEPVVKASTLDWTSSARWGDTVAVDAETEKLGRTSVTVRCTIRVGERLLCVVRNTYVATDAGRSDAVARRHPRGAGGGAHRDLTPGGRNGSPCGRPRLDQPPERVGVGVLGDQVAEAVEPSLADGGEVGVGGDDEAAGR